VIQNLEARKEGTPEDILLATLEASGASELEEALLQCHFDKVEGKKALESLVRRKQVVVIGTEDIHQLLFSRGHWEHLIKEVTALVQSYHSQFPLRRGMPKVELKSQLRKMPRYFDGILRKLVGEGVLVEEGTTVSLPSHSVRLSQGQQAKVDAFLKAITQNPYYPPADLSLDTELLNMLLQEGKVVKVGEGVIFSHFAYEEMVKQIIEHIKNHGRITVAEVRDMFQTSRKYAVALMEYLDDQKITRRIGNERLLK